MIATTRSPWIQQKGYYYRLFFCLFKETLVWQWGKKTEKCLRSEAFQIIVTDCLQEERKGNIQKQEKCIENRGESHGQDPRGDRMKNSGPGLALIDGSEAVFGNQ